MRYLKQFILTAILFLTGSISFAQDNLPVSGQIAGHDYIDLGLPSGTLWATYNVGATKPEQYGYYFAWGETEPKDVYNDWSTYKYATTIGEDLDSITKYNMSGRYGIIDSLSTLLPEDDAAAANWGSEWRMPTNEEQGELYENSYMVWTDGYNGTDVSGVIFYKAKEDSDKGQYMAPWRGEPSADYSESSDAHVFFPAAGYRLGSDVLAKGNCGYYWSSSLYEKREDFAHDLGFSGKDVGWNYSVRGYGCPVRAVANKTTDIEEYVVSFYTQDSVLIESQKVEKGKSATAVDAPVVDGYEFIGWSDSSFTNVTKDLDIYAQYRLLMSDNEKDSIWGLEWNLEGSKLEISLLSTYTSSGKGDYFILEITTYTEGEYSDRYRYDYVNYCSTDARIVNTHRSMIMNSIKIDTLSVGLYRITAYLSLIEDYLKVPEDMSNYHGYFGITMLSDNKEVEDDYYNNCFNYTQCRQFLYFDLIGEFSSLEDINLRDGLYSESYYSMTGIPTSVKNTKEPLVVVVKDGEGKIVERSVRIIRK